jgi:hypothetical protein
MGVVTSINRVVRWDRETRQASSRSGGGGEGGFDPLFRSLLIHRLD